MKRNLEGIYIPAVTPFEEDGTLSVPMLEFNIQKWNTTAVSGYMCLGSNGEFRMLDDEESLTVIAAFERCRAKEKGLIAGVGRESLYHTLKLIDRMQRMQLNPDYISILTPHYFRKAMDDRALTEYYTEIADRSPYPVLLYCAPGFANTVCISETVVKTLADHPNIHGLKDTTPDRMDAYMDAVGGRQDFSVMAGSINTLHRCLKRGGRGAVVSAANYFPQECAELFALWDREPEEVFSEYEENLRLLIRKTGARGGVSGVKCCMNLRGYQAGIPRRPLLPADAETTEEIREALAAAIDIRGKAKYNNSVSSYYNV